LVLHTGEHPAKLKDMVTTPAGCTIDGLLELEEGGLRVTLIKAVVRAAQRARELVESQNTSTGSAGVPHSALPCALHAERDAADGELQEVKQLR